MSALEKIEAQQKGREGTAPWMVGEQLKDMLRAEPWLEDLLDKDLDVKDMSLAAAEKKIKDYADKHKTGNFACVTPTVAEGILREFYGLPKRGEETPIGPSGHFPKRGKQEPERKIVRLEDFL